MGMTRKIKDFISRIFSARVRIVQILLILFLAVIAYDLYDPRKYFITQITLPKILNEQGLTQDYLTRKILTYHNYIVTKYGGGNTVFLNSLSHLSIQMTDPKKDAAHLLASPTPIDYKIPIIGISIADLTNVLAGLVGWKRKEIQFSIFCNNQSCTTNDFVISIESEYGEFPIEIRIDKNRAKEIMGRLSVLDIVRSDQTEGDVILFAAALQSLYITNPYPRSFMFLNWPDEIIKPTGSNLDIVPRTTTEQLAYMMAEFRKHETSANKEGMIEQCKNTLVYVKRFSLRPEQYNEIYYPLAICYYVIGEKKTAMQYTEQLMSKLMEKERNEFAAYMSALAKQF